MAPLQPDTSYHIFNHANGFENIFRHEANYYFFLEKYWKYIGPIAETYAWCLMPNHFHLVVRIRKRAVLINNDNFSKVVGFENGVYKTQSDPSRTGNQNFGKVFGFENGGNKAQSNLSRTDSQNFSKVIVEDISDSDIEKYLSKQFANLFSCYTQSFNKVYGRMGSLFIKNFKRIPISDRTNFLHAVVYTHRNPVHHGFCKQMEDWPYSSYNQFIDGNGNDSGIETVKLLKMVGGPEGFLKMHQRAVEKIDSSTFPDIPLSL